METNEKNISPEEGLLLIHTMINTARNKVSEDGFHLLLWGVLVISCCLINYALLVFEYGHWSGFVWMLMPFIGVPVGIIYEKKRAQKGGVRTHYDMHIAYMWWGYGLTLGLLIAFCIYSRISPVPFILLITGLVTYATGKMIQFTPLIIGALIFWVSAILCLWITGIEQLLVEAASIFFGYIVPGFILRRNAKQEHHVQTA